MSGASSGIGRAVAEAFAAEGAELVLVARPEDGPQLRAAAAAIGPRVVTIPADLGEADVAGSVVAQAVQAFGRVDVLVNNAGFADVGPALEVPVERWDRVMAVNLRAMFLLAQAFSRHALARGGGGAIVNTASTNAIRPEPLLAAYNASKAGVVSLTQSLALELGRQGIRVNAVLPGMVHTRQTEQLLRDPVFLRAYEAAIPVGRVAEPADIAPVYVFLASDDARYVTGALVVVDGGLSVGMTWPDVTVSYPDFA